MSINIRVNNFINKASQDINKNIREVSLHYPKTLLIATVANIIFTILTASLTGYIGLALNCYFLYPHKTHILTAIDVHEANNIAEWSSTFKEKQDLIPAINRRVWIKDISKSFGRFVSKIYLRHRVNKATTSFKSLFHLY